MKKFILLSALLTISVLSFSQVPPAVSLTRETFGTLCWDTGSPCTNNPAPQQKRGSNPHWDFDDINTFTSENGTWTTPLQGDSSIRLNSYLDDPAVQGYTGASEGMHLHLVTPTRNGGSWDSVMFTGIDVDGYSGLSVNFGYVKRGGGANDYVQQSRGLIVKVRIDGGAWTMLDSTALPAAHPSQTWAFIEMAIPEAIQGSSLDILFTTSRGSLGLDDIEVTGRAKPIQLTKETFGTLCWDTGSPCTNNPAPQQKRGSNPHWDFDDINTFTSELGTWTTPLTGDSSIRINSYLDDPAVQGYPGASEGMHLHLVTPTRNGGSWDSVMFTGIDIEEYYGFFVRFGYVKRGGGANDYVQQSRGLIVKVRVDGGPWTMLDSTAIPAAHPSQTWVQVTMQVPIALNGESMDILFTSSRGSLGLDDIEILGRPAGEVIYVDRVVVLSPEGNSTGLGINTDTGTLQLEAIVTPTDATSPVITWSVVDPLFGTVSSTGLASGRKNGVLGVIASADDQGGIVGDTVWISLTNHVLPVTSVTITPNGPLPVTDFQDSIQFTASVLPADADNTTVTWSVDSDKASISESGLLVTRFRSGDVVVTATSNNGRRDTSRVQISLMVVENEDPAEADVDLRVYPTSPNHFSSILNVEGADIHQVRMMDTQGTTVKSIYNEKKQRTVSFDVSGTAAGLYLIKVSTLDGKVHVRKVIKK